MPVIRTQCGTRQWIGIVATLGMVLLNTGVLNAGPPRIGFLAVESTLDEMGPHNQAAWRTAARLGEATLLLRQKDGSFADSSGHARNMSDFDVLWYHQGDAIERNLMYQGRSLAEIQQFAASGGGVLLSGGALAMVAQLGLETQIRPQRHELDNWRDPAGMVPVEKTHPAFTRPGERCGPRLAEPRGLPCGGRFLLGRTRGRHDSGENALRPGESSGRIRVGRKGV